LKCFSGVIKRHCGNKPLFSSVMLYRVEKHVYKDGFYIFTRLKRVFFNGYSNNNKKKLSPIHYNGLLGNDFGNR